MVLDLALCVQRMCVVFNRFKWLHSKHNWYENLLKINFEMNFMLYICVYLFISMPIGNIMSSSLNFFLIYLNDIPWNKVEPQFYIELGVMELYFEESLSAPQQFRQKFLCDFLYSYLLSMVIP